MGLLNMAYKYLLQADPALAAEAAKPLIYGFSIPVYILLVLFWVPMIVIQFRAFFTAMEAHFPGCCLVFDCANQKAVKVMLKTYVKSAGITDVTKYFYVNNPLKDLPPWFKGAKISAKGYMTGYIDLNVPSVSGAMRLLSKIGDSFMKMRIAKIEF